ncbi:HipA domain-containing protein [Thiorhodovibrio frisius]|uniref:hypothetical protein n=1 Tax=Thiorhodovibrio frisius TaxID=631362 RepID=UPI00022C69BC|nr:hypothetical protein [Thiorhodovibrio frisius]
MDAWIANQDRHHENWGLINHEKRIYLAPTFDHAASMGQNETDATREKRLTTRDHGRHIRHYVTKARSAIYDQRTSKKPLTTLALFELAAHKSPRAGATWLKRLAQVREESVQSIFDELSPKDASPLAKEFAQTLLSLNQMRLLELRS